MAAAGVGQPAAHPVEHPVPDREILLVVPFHREGVVEPGQDRRRVAEVGVRAATAPAGRSPPRPTAAPPRRRGRRRRAGRRRSGRGRSSRSRSSRRPSCEEGSNRQRVRTAPSSGSGSSERTYFAACDSSRSRCCWLAIRSRWRRATSTRPSSRSTTRAISPQRLDLGRRRGPGPAVGDAEGADLVPAGAGERVAGIEPDVRLAGHERVVAEPLVLGGVGDDHRLVREDGVPAEGDGARGLRRGQAAGGLEPLAVGIHQRDVGHRAPARRASGAG